MQRLLADPPPDRLFEISEYTLAGVAPRDPHRLNRERLTERGLMASPSLPNFVKPQLYRDALARLHDTAAKNAHTALIIPDYAVRMAILDFEQLPAGEQERMSLIRFRLRKTVPFHIEEAQLSYAVQKEEPGRVEVLAVAIAHPILQEYESLFAEAGYRVGLVTPSLIAALPFCESSQPGITLFAKVNAATLSMALLEHGKLRLVRCLDLVDEETDVQERQGREDPILRILRQTLAFAEDQFGHSVTHALLCGFGVDTAQLGNQIEREFGIEWTPARSRFGVALEENSGMLGLLEQYAA